MMRRRTMWTAFSVLIPVRWQISRGAQPVHEEEEDPVLVLAQVRLVEAGQDGVPVTGSAGSRPRGRRRPRARGRGRRGRIVVAPQRGPGRLAAQVRQDEVPRHRLDELGPPARVPGAEAPVPVLEEQDERLLHQVLDLGAGRAAAQHAGHAGVDHRAERAHHRPEGGLVTLRGGSDELDRRGRSPAATAARAPRRGLLQNIRVHDPCYAGVAPILSTAGHQRAFQTKHGRRGSGLHPLRGVRRRRPDPSGLGQP